MHHKQEQPTPSTPLTVVEQRCFDTWKAGLAEGSVLGNWLVTSGFVPAPGATLLVPNARGTCVQALVVADATDIWWAGDLANRLPAGAYHVADVIDQGVEIDLEAMARAWALGAYRYEALKSTHGPAQATLATPVGVDAVALAHCVEAVNRVRTWMNQPANVCHPAYLEETMRACAAPYGATVTSVVGDDLLEAGYPAVHAVGRASAYPPRMLMLSWEGDPEGPSLALVGKGVCFDSGGLDLKPPKAMRLMKKDMGGAAHALSLAAWIMASGWPIRLRVWLPAVENAVSSNAFRPGDVIPTRQGSSVEVGDTDAEGRLILADALADAAAWSPDLLVDFATLTGAARVALGTVLPACFTHDEGLAEQLMQHAEATQDPVWRMPLFAPYRSLLKSEVADLCSTSSSPYGGAITAALFLDHFVTDGGCQPPPAWVHMDLMGFTPHKLPGRPQGGEAMGLRAMYALCQDRLGIQG